MNGKQAGPDHDAIAARAYAIYLARGGTDGLDEDDWLQAEFELAGDGGRAPDAGPNVPLGGGDEGKRAQDVTAPVRNPAPSRPGEPLPDSARE